MKNLIRLFLMLIFLSGCAHFQTCRTPMQPFLWGCYGEGHAARVSSYDKTGANNDNIQILPGQTVTIADISGAGIIRHIWTTTNAKGPIGRTLVVRMYWDGSETPAVEVPFGDFFGVGHGLEADVNSFPITNVSNGRSRNCWWQMPFSNGARITISNEGSETHGAFYFHIDYLALDKPPITKERFYAQYRQAYPADFPENYTLLETTGSGYYMGVVMSVESTKAQWWGEGDDLIEADDYEPIRGTGTEDYFCDAWGIRQHSTLWHGSPLCEGFAEAGKRTSMYRFHILDPIPFKKKIHVSIEHGTGNNRADNLSSVAFWYQVPPASTFPQLPPVEERLSGAEKITFVRERALQIATSASSDAHQQLSNLLKRVKDEENKVLIQGLIAYAEGISKESEDSLTVLDATLKQLKEMIDKLPENERYAPPKIDVPTDDDSPIPSSLVKAYRTIERARNDLARKIALKRGFRPGDEIIVESRDSLGQPTLLSTYQDTSDFSNSYAKVDDTHLLGNGARFTYGNADPSWARFTPNFPRSGRYEVFTIFSYGANTDDTRYEIRHSDGMTTISLKQRGRPGLEGRNNAVWHSLGTYRFEAGQNVDKGSVMLNVAPGTTNPEPKFEYRAYADAVRFVFVGE